jgi:uncharacterized membrane protein
MPSFRLLDRSLLAVSTLAVALAAGFFYAYACSVLYGLARLDDRAAIAAMQAINATVRNPVFAFAFFGALAFPAALLALRLARARFGRSEIWLTAAVALYGLAGFALTFLASVPLNQWLATVPLDGAVDLATARARYFGPWDAWNWTRTAATGAAALCLALVWFEDGRKAA